MKKERTRLGFLKFICGAFLLGLGACGAQGKRGMDPGLPTVDALRAQGWLPIPPRLQWSNDHGYCGETSLQAIALYYGAWISQKVAREAGGGELLLGHNAERAIAALHFELESWLPKPKKANFENFMLWLKKNLMERKPAIITVYLSGIEHDADGYDHIVPVIGIKPYDLKSAHFDHRDILAFHNNFAAQPILRPFGSLKGTKDDCPSNLEDGGCIPQQEIYALVIKGIADRQKTSLPIHMSVEHWDEPNVSAGEAPRPMSAELNVTHLVKGRAYALLRYHQADKVPVTGDVRDFLASKYDLRHDFIAPGSEFTYRDPQPFPSDGVVYYRCVPL